MSRSRPSQLHAAEIELGVAASSGALLVHVDRSLIHHEQVGRQAQHCAVGLEDQMLHAGELRVERAEQLAVQLVRQGDVERVGRALAVLDRGDRVAQRIDLLVELLAGGVERGRRAPRSGVTSIA